MGKGCVYVLTNPCIRYTYREGGRDVTISPVKIGMAKDVEKRLGSLNTSLPENFVHHISVFSNDAKALENIVHRLLASYRIDTKDGDRTEFFRCTVEHAVAVLKQTAKDMHLKEHKIDKSKLIGRSSCKIKSNSRAFREVKMSKTVRPKLSSVATTRTAKKLPNFLFAAVGVPVGATLTFTETPLKVTVLDEKNKVEYKGHPYSLSGFVKAFHPSPNSSGSYRGPKFFTYNGQRLTDLRKVGAECPTPCASIRSAPAPLPDRKILRCASRGTDANGYATDGGFVVMKGSRLSLQVTTSFVTCKQEVKMREAFLKDGTIVGDRLTRDVRCPSISSAAKFVMGASANGKKEWK